MMHSVDANITGQLSYISSLAHYLFYVSVNTVRPFMVIQIHHCSCGFNELKGRLSNLLTHFLKTDIDSRKKREKKEKQGNYFCSILIKVLSKPRNISAQPFVITSFAVKREK